MSVSSTLEYDIESIFDSSVCSNISSNTTAIFSESPYKSFISHSKEIDIVDDFNNKFSYNIDSDGLFVDDNSNKSDEECLDSFNEDIKNIKEELLNVKKTMFDKSTKYMNNYIGYNLSTPNIKDNTKQIEIIHFAEEDKNYENDKVSDKHSENINTFPTKNNITTFLNITKYTYDNTREIINNMLINIEDAIDIGKKFCAKALLLFISQKIQFLVDNPLYALLIKAHAHEFIVIRGYHDLIPIYNIIFNDNLYEDINNTQLFAPVLSKEWVEEKIKQYQEECLHIEWKQNAKRKPPKYMKNEIVGAKDKEGKWWMSKILGIYAYQQCIAYYVEFLGWDEKFNEFITDSYRIERFNPKKHKYYRPSWKNKDSVIFEEELVTKVVENTITNLVTDTVDSDNMPLNMAESAKASFEEPDEFYNVDIKQ